LAEAPNCAGGRTCLDERGRWWLRGEPFIPRGLYNAGYEYERVLSNCPEGASCQDTTPADLEDYLEQMADAGFNLIQERSRFTAALRAAVNAHPKIYFAHLLWSDPFTEEGRQALIEEIEAAAEDPDVVMWFGPDEVDLWDNWPQAAGIRRLLRGSSAELDEALAQTWAPGPDAFLPDDEPAHDPYALPFGAATHAASALSQAAPLYEALMPTIYPIQGPRSFLDAEAWGTPRVRRAAEHGATALPVLQMYEMDGMGLGRPSPDQISALIASAMVQGGRGAFYFTYIADAPSHAGRNGWYAPDDWANFAAFGAMHALQDSLKPVLFSAATETADTSEAVQWRRWDLDDRTLLLAVNVRPTAQTIDLATLLPGKTILRFYERCAALESMRLELGGYELVVVEAL
jgi:hypothetical protein